MTGKPIIVWVEDDFYIIYPLIEPLESEFEIRGYCSLKELSDDHELPLHVEDVALVLLDMMFKEDLGDPGPDRLLGIIALQRLRTLGITAPCIVLSVLSPSHLSRKEQELMKEEGYALWLRKPVTTKELEAAIHQSRTTGSEIPKVLS